MTVEDVPSRESRCDFGGMAREWFRDVEVLSTIRLMSFDDMFPPCGLRTQSPQLMQTVACKASRATEYCGRRLEPEVTQNNTPAFATTYGSLANL